MPAEVVVIGNAGLDTNVFLPGGDVDWTVEANFTENLDCVGQAGGYASRGYAALGRRTAFIGALGDDAAGAQVRAALAGDGVDLQGVFLDPTGTARSVNILGRDGGRKNFYDGKGHRDLRPDLARCRRAMAGARLAHVHLPDWARRLLPLARELGLVVACDLQDVVDPDDPYRRDFLQAADYVFFSAANHADPGPLLEAFRAGRRERIVIAGLGAAGCALASPEGIRRFPPVPMELPVVDSNGAGDALAVGFLASRVLEGRSLEESILRGQVAARWTCAQRADSSHLIGAAELDRRARALQDGSRS